MPQFIDLIKYIFLGIIQGLTEFLPVSSSGHLTLFQSLFDISGNLAMLDLFLHIGTFFAVLYAFKSKILSLIIKKDKNKILFRPNYKYISYLAIATLPACLYILLFKGSIEQSFTLKTTAIGFLITATLLLITDYFKGRKEINFLTALVMGIMQTVAVYPGVSRSGSTLFGGSLLGCDKEKVLEFSFLQSGILIFLSICYAVLNKEISAISLPILIGMVFAFVFSKISIDLMLKLVKKISLKWFSLYLCLASIAITLFL